MEVAVEAIGRGDAMNLKSFLVLNGGSSSIKFSIYAADFPHALLFEGKATEIGAPQAEMELRKFDNGKASEVKYAVDAKDLHSFENAVDKILEIIAEADMPAPLAIGHRVVHPGPNLKKHQRLTADVLAELEKAIPLAPLHLPLNIEIIKAAMRRFPAVKNFACFDTVFHQTMPEAASLYPVPKELYEKGIHRYGFHGISCESIIDQFSEVPQRLIIAHLGSGCSVTAVRKGRSIDTTMGLTPCGGVIMKNRSGDLDPGLIFYLARHDSTNSLNAIDEVEKLLNEKSGFNAISEISDSTIGREAFVLSIKKSIGSYIAILGGVDAIVFTGGIGENDSEFRSQVCRGMKDLGIALDQTKNSWPTARVVSEHKSPVDILVMPAEENRMIMTHVLALSAAKSEMTH